MSERRLRSQFLFKYFIESDKNYAELEFLKSLWGPGTEEE
jgi:hypothetical protein